MKTLCRCCNNSVKINNEYICLNKSKCKVFKTQAQELKKYCYIHNLKGEVNLFSIVCLVYLGFMLVVLLTIF